MWRLQGVKAAIEQRLAAAVEDIMGHLERAMGEYEAEVEGRLAAALAAGAGPRGTDVQQPLLIKEEQQEWSSSQQPAVKEETEDSWSSQGFTCELTQVPVKSEGDEGEARPSHSDPSREARPAAVETEADADGRAGLEPRRAAASGLRCAPARGGQTPPPCAAVPGHRGGNWVEAQRTPTDLTTVTNAVPISNAGCNSGSKSFSCSKCSKRFGQKHHLQTHMRCHTGEKPFSCSLCGKRFTQKGNLTQHLTVHTREKPCSCPVCGERFAQKGNLTQHMTVHTRERLCERLSASKWDSERTELHLGQNIQ